MRISSRSLQHVMKMFYLRNQFLVPSQITKAVIRLFIPLPKCRTHITQATFECLREEKYERLNKNVCCISYVLYLPQLQTPLPSTFSHPSLLLCLLLLSPVPLLSFHSTLFPELITLHHSLLPSLFLLRSPTFSLRSPLPPSFPLSSSALHPSLDTYLKR